MGRPQPVNDMLDARLAGLQAHGWSPMLSEAVNAALGVPPGASRDAASTPVIGFYLVEGIVGSSLTLYLVTPARFIRYEVLGARALTVAVPLSRLSQVTELVDYEAQTLTLTVEMDAGAHVVTFGYEEVGESHEGAPHTQGRGEARAVPTTYEIVAGASSGGDGELSWFARTLRAALGA